MSAEELPPQKVLHDVFGTLLVGTWISSMVLAVEIRQAFRYFALFDQDRLWIRGLVVSMLSIDLMGACAACGLAYRVSNWTTMKLCAHSQQYLVVGWGNIVEMETQNL